MSARQIAELVTAMGSPRPRVRPGPGKKLRRLAERHPERLAPHFDRFVRLLDHPNKLVQWEALIILSHLAQAVSDRRFDTAFGRYFAPIRGPVLITAANAILGGARIALAKPQWADRIAREIRTVSRARYQTAECRRIVAGHAILAFDTIFPLLGDKVSVIRFVRAQSRSQRPATRAKARRFLRRRAL